MKTLKLKNINFGTIFVASGTLNFFGEGWPYHRLSAVYSVLSGITDLLMPLGFLG